MTQKHVSIIMAIIAGLALITTVANIFITSVRADTTRTTKASITDSVQNAGIEAVKSSINAVNIRVDMVVDKQNTTNTQTAKDINDIKESQQIIIIMLKKINDNIGKSDYNTFLPTGYMWSTPNNNQTLKTY